MATTVQVKLGKSIDPEIQRLRECHELYNLYLPDWEFYVDSYSGGKEVVLGKNIFKHVREHDEDYRDRLKRAHYLNYCAPVVDFYTNFIFSDIIERDGGIDNEWCQNFFLDVNKKGESIDEFMSCVSTDSQIFGQVFVLVDSPNINLADQEVQVLSKLQEEEKGIRPYWVLMHPTEILDWSTDDFSNYTYVKRRQVVVDRDPTSTKKNVYEKYTEWTKDRVYINYIDITDDTNPIYVGTKKLEIGNPIGEIPIVCIKYKKSKKYKDMGESFLKDIAPNNREVLNLTSLIDEFLFRQCFNMLAREREASFPLQSADQEEIGTANVLEFPKGGTPPVYVSPPVDPAEFLQSEREKITSEIYRQAVQDLRTDLANGEKSSGFSQSQAFSRTVPYISSRADIFEKSETRLMSLTMKFVKKVWKGKIKYKDHYEVTSLIDAMTQLTSLFKDLALPSPTFAITQLKRLVTELDGKLPPDVVTKVFDEIENMNFKEWQSKVRNTDIKKASASPLAQQKPANTPSTSQEISKEAKANVGSTTKLKKTK